MKIVQSFWSTPLFQELGGKKLHQYSGRWLHWRYHLMSWALSCLKLREFYPEVCLVTDKIGKELLIDQMQLPYTEVQVRLDEINSYDPNLWALGKIYTYRIQKEPFLHVDADVFTWKKFDEDLLKAPLIAQSEEQDFDSFYLPILEDIYQHCSSVPSILRTYCPPAGKSVNGANAGIFGGQNLDFFQDYTQRIFAFIDSNQKELKQVKVTMINAVLEQVLFYYLARDKGIPISYYLPELLQPFEEVVRFNLLPNVSHYIHAIGDFKQKEWICGEIELRLRFEFPEYYSKLLKRFNLQPLVIPDKLSRRKSVRRAFSIYEYLEKSSKELLWQKKFCLNPAFSYAIVEKEKSAFSKLAYDRELVFCRGAQNSDLIIPLRNWDSLLQYFQQPNSACDLFSRVYGVLKEEGMTVERASEKLLCFITRKWLYDGVLEPASG